MAAVLSNERLVVFWALREIEGYFFPVSKRVLFCSKSSCLKPFDKCIWLMHFTETRVEKCCIARKGGPEKVGDFHVFTYCKFRAQRYTNRLQ